MELATPLIRRGPRSALISVSLIDGRAVARIACEGPLTNCDWIAFSLAGSGMAVEPSGGGGTSYDGGGMYLNSLTFRRVDGEQVTSLRDLLLTLDGHEYELQPVELGRLRTSELPGSVRTSSDGSRCPGCDAAGPGGMPKTYCDACTSAIDRASVLGATVAEPPIRVMPVGTAIGVVDGAEVTVLDIEVYPELSLMRTWWAAEAAPTQALERLRCPLDRRLELLTTTAQHVVAPGSSSHTDGGGVETQHRIVGPVDPDTPTVTLSVPGVALGEVVIDVVG